MIRKRRRNQLLINENEMSLFFFVFVNAEKKKNKNFCSYKLNNFNLIVKNLTKENTLKFCVK